MPPVSVVVLAYENGDAIGECLKSLGAQDYPNLEIVVTLDKTSRDKTAEVVNDFLMSHPSSRLEECSGVGRSKARNIGWKDCDSQIIMFADGDDVFEPWYVSKAVDSLEKDSREGGVCLGGTALVQGNSRLERYHRAFGGTDVRVAQGPDENPDWAWVYWRRCLETVGGFDEGLAQAEDKDLCTRVKGAGYKIGYVSGVHWFHRKPESFSSLLKKEYKGGRRRIVFEAKHRDYRSAVIGVVPLLYVIVCLASYFYLGPTGTVLLLAIGGIAYSTNAVLRRRFTSTSRGDALAFIPVVLATKLAQSIGAVHGIILLALSRGGLAHPDFGRI